jgi:3-hydroxyisobutyrate dehydrogenase
MTASIGFIGLGNMGGRICARIVDSGADVLGFDQNPDAVARLGVSQATSPAQVADEADIIFLSLPDSTVVESVVYAGGLLKAIRQGTIVCDLTTAAPESTEIIAQHFLDSGAVFLDAGVSGGAAAAEAGTLTLMVGGDQEALDRIRPVVDTFASAVYHLGKSGAGHTAKLLNNFLNAIALSATSEVMVAAKKAGLDLAVLLDVLNSSSGVNFATLNRFPKMITGDYLKGGLTNALMLKDVVLYQELIASLGVFGVNGAGPLAAFGLAGSLGYRDEISNTVVDAIGDLSGGVRIHDGGTNP